MARIRIKLNKKGMRELLTVAVAADLKARADRVAAAAGPGHNVHVETGGRRARAAVVTASIDAMRAEARDRNLTRAFGAGR